jgi:hypothetical protein
MGLLFLRQALAWRVQDKTTKMAHIFESLN